ncbi:MULTISPECIES: THUMP-like domain-containing protein [Flavobacteriaceae]|uniref:THUMP-like domain-containing protein n=1 Tax=Flavobacteriaceae TaxID=49546 RepID=UPI0028BEC737|nr:MULTISPECIES: class I SAM-dependent methyltransferase [Allomuricauda]
MSVLLKKPLFEGISQKELAEQLEAKKKSKDKLPTWFSAPKIYYPNKLNIEQTSSELTAQYKANLINGKSLVDVTGGLGVDTYFFSKKIDIVFHCEINTELSKIAAHNFDILGQKNIKCIPEDGIAYLKKIPEEFDWIYIDPSRRNDVKGKVFLLQDCLPNLPEQLDNLFEKSKNILVKTSPLLDIKQGLQELDFVKEIHVVSVKNEVKELLFILEHDFSGDVLLKTINLLPNSQEVFNFELEKEKEAIVELDTPKEYLYEPNAAILKSGGFKSVGNYFGLKKLHLHSHLYTASTFVDFPGRVFSVLEIIPYSKTNLKKFARNKANITTRNFPIPVTELRKKHNIKDGGEVYLFFTTSEKDTLVVLDCRKV